MPTGTIYKLTLHTGRKREGQHEHYHRERERNPHTRSKIIPLWIIESSLITFDSPTLQLRDNPSVTGGDQKVEKQVDSPGPAGRREV